MSHSVFPQYRAEKILEPALPRGFSLYRVHGIDSAHEDEIRGLLGTALPTDIPEMPRYASGITVHSESEHGVVLCLRKKRELVGVADAYFTEKPGQPSTALYSNLTFVRPDLRKADLGTFLFGLKLEHALKHARDNGLSFTHVNAQSAGEAGRRLLTRAFPTLMRDALHVDIPIEQLEPFLAQIRTDYVKKHPPKATVLERLRGLIRRK